jgi:hypothetical protein
MFEKGPPLFTSGQKHYSKQGRSFFLKQAMPVTLDRGICVWDGEKQQVGQREDTQEPNRNQYQKNAGLPLVQPTASHAAVSGATFSHVTLR